jgi:hypothetical protein
MAHSDKNIVITPNISSTTADPRIVFSGADASTGPQNITLQVYPTNSGTLSFEGSTGQLFSITNSMSGTIFSANDVSGIPSIEVLDTGLVKIAQYSGNLLIGSGTDSGIAKVQITGDQTVSGKTVYGPNTTWGAYLQVGGSSREYVDNGTYASVAASDGNLHLDAGSGKDLYLNYYDGSSVRIGNGANSHVATFNTSGSLTLNGSLTVGNGANASSIYMSDSDEGARELHCNSNRIGFLTQAGSWGAYCDDSGNWYANNISGSTSGTNTGDQTSVSGNAGTVGGFTPSASSGTANRVVVADANGYIFNNYFNSTDDTTTATLTYIMGKFGDNYLRSASAAKVATFISGQTMNIAGSSTSVAGLTLNSSSVSINPNDVTQNQIGYNTSVSLFGQTDGGLYSSAHSSSWIHQIYGDFRTGQIAIRGKNNGTWQAWRRVVDESNYSTIVTTVSGSSGSCSGNAATATRAAGNFYIDTACGRGVVGLYDSYRYQGVFAMGDAYKLADNGTTTGSLYGLAWSHPNAGGAAGNLTDHGLLVINNGVFKCAISNSIVASGNITAFSDERLKTNWRDMPEDFVARLAQVKVGVYDRTDEENSTQVGVSAQSLQKLLPHAIMTAKDDMQTLSVNYGGASLASAVELAKDNVELRARIEKLEALVQSLLNKE